jgi:2'-5' RNA ligase
VSTRRLFFGLWPDHRQRDRLRDFITPLAKEVDGRIIDRHKWHVTLAFIGNFEEQLIPALQRAAEEVEVEPFRLRFDRLEFWPRPKVASLVAATVPPELQALVQQLNAILLRAGVLVEERTYRPHITVARNARPFETMRPAQAAITEWNGFELIESVSERGGAVYRPLDQ